MLPAKLTPIEDFFLLEDSPEYLMTVLMRLRLAGRLDRLPFQAAVGEVVAKHPLLQAKIEVVGETKRWVSCPDWQPEVMWDVQCDEAAWPPASYIDIREEPATRISVVQRAEYDEVIVQVHHCCTDATGLIRFTEDLLIAYAQRCDSNDESLVPAAREVNLQRFPHRGLPGMPRWRFLIMFHRWIARIHDCGKILRRRCSQLLPDKPVEQQSEETTSYPALRIMRFDRETTQKIIGAAKSNGVTVNSILLRDLFLTIRDWREQLGVNRDDDLLRFCVPVNLRTVRDQSLTVANSISLIFMDRNDKQMQSESNLLHSLYDELHNKSRQDLRISFVTMLDVGWRLPVGLKRFITSRSCWSTCLFSSLGVVLRDTILPQEEGLVVAENVRLEQWDLVPPMRDNLGLTVCPYTYAGRMSIVFNYDPTRVNGEQLALMLQTYLSRLESSTGLEQGKLAEKNLV